MDNQTPLVYVLGDTGYLGTALVKALHQRGYVVVGISRRAWSDTSPSYTHIEADITENTEGVLEAVLAQYGLPLCVINTTGSFVSKSIDALTDQDIDKMVRTNMVTPAHILRTLLPHYKRAGVSKNMEENRSILQISSAGMHPSVVLKDRRPIAMYGATKAGVTALYIGASKEFGSVGVRINVLAPTYFSGDIQKVERLATMSIETITTRVHGSVLE